MRKHLIIASYDGVGTHYCGVGTITNNLIRSLREVITTKDIRVSVAYVNVDKTSEIYSSEHLDCASAVAKESDGQLLSLCNGTNGKSEWEMWGGFTEWKHACTSLVTALNITLDPQESNFIILNDTPFLQFSKYKHLIFDKRIMCFYFPMSTGKNHAFGDAGWRKRRIAEEERCFEKISTDVNSKVIALGSTFAQHLSKSYGIRIREKDFLQNGLCFEQYEAFTKRKFEREALHRFGIHLDKHEKIIFSWGRCSIAKGFMQLAEAWSKIHDALPDHHLILQMPNNSGEPDYFDQVRSILAPIPRTKIIDDFNPDIWQTILRTAATDAVCIPSLMDPFPHTAIEAKLFSANMNYVTIVSNLDGAVDAFNSDEAIHVDPTNTRKFSEALIKASLMNEEERRVIIDSSQNSISKFFFPSILRQFLESNMEL